MSYNHHHRLGVLGGGSFGTAIADLLGAKGFSVDMWVHDPASANDIMKYRENKKYLPGFELSSNINATSNLEDVVNNKSILVAVSPSHSTRALMEKVSSIIDPSTIVVCATKGIEQKTGLMMSQVLEETLPKSNQKRIACLSGPSFAREILQKFPTAVTIASLNHEISSEVQKVFTTSYFRAYTVTDVVGVEIAGAVKNVMAIAAGISDGLGFGHNARAALISRGLAEISRLGVKMGADPITFMGLAGLGDLVLTCTGDLSRNRTVGLHLANGESLDDILKKMGQIAEGVKTTAAVFDMAKKYEVEMPIVQATFDILYKSKSPRIAVMELMNRPLRSEQG